MTNRSERKKANAALQQQIETLFQQIFVAGVTLGARLKDMPEKLAKDISAAKGDAGKIETLIRAELEGVLAAAMSKLRRHLVN
jgi:hypothetical protein